MPSGRRKGTATQRAASLMRLDDRLRVTAKAKDDLQAVIRALKDEDFGIPLQFTNYR